MKWDRLLAYVTLGWSTMLLLHVFFNAPNIYGLIGGAAFFALAMTVCILYVVKKT